MVESSMNRFANRQRPPIFASLWLFGAMALLTPPAPTRVAMGPAPRCVVHGERYREILVPSGTWDTPVASPHGRFNMPIFGERTSEPLFDVDAVVSALKRLATPRQT